ncbi:MAG: hypothetical protein J6O61_14440 [Butyrivibrio sp.]|uniref:hypothetical protein n=1 Tax=Butyrivibrio sp. TaxID=28121 RepID=UPI001B04C6EB|nr:hypothetical protein [Butyrivibrio sp.]MBO6242000.1 hypothetical protein [Butyrivibrio sp.]
MAIDVYDGIPKKEITAERITSEGKKYTLNHPNELVINMRYKGEGMANANSQGWERSSNYYFKELLSKHPEVFSKKNNLRIDNGESPRVDARFVKCFPQYKGYENETLIHHHIGKDGQAVALPQSVHKGSGEIHIYENQLGITDKARAFSDKCREACAKKPKMVDQTSDMFKRNSLKQTVSKQENTKQNAITRASTNSVGLSSHSPQKINSIKTASANSTSAGVAKTSGSKSQSR